ncbi:MAG: glutathione S-transferase family protein [Dongiaceae bacterium]
MRLLYHFSLDPASRFARLALAEKKLDFALREERAWERREAFLDLNPACEVPVLVESEGATVAGAPAIVEYIDETSGGESLIGTGAVQRAEVRRLVQWFMAKFDREVTRYLLGQKVMDRLAGRGVPDAMLIRAGLTNLRLHVDYLGWLAEHRNWLAGERFSLADIAAAAHVSVIDYLGDMPWDANAAAKDWYQRIKSRPSFRPLLTDRVTGAPPPAHYADLDF